MNNSDGKVTDPRWPTEAVILDFDGVIVDSLTVHLEAWKAAVRQLFNQPLDDVNSIVGHGTQAISGILANRCGDPTMAKALARLKQQLVVTYAPRVPTFPGVRDFLADLQGRRLPHGIASNSPSAFVRAALQALSLDVPVTMTSDDVARPKPHPDLFFACANALGVPFSCRHRILVFEDSEHGIKAACRAKMTPIGITSNQPATKLLRAGAAATFSSLGEALGHRIVERDLVNHGIA